MVPKVRNAQVIAINRPVLLLTMWCCIGSGCKVEPREAQIIDSRPSSTHTSELATDRDVLRLSSETQQARFPIGPVTEPASTQLDSAAMARKPGEQKHPSGKPVIDAQLCTVVNPVAEMEYCSGNAHHCQDSYASCRRSCRSYGNPLNYGACITACYFAFHDCVTSKIGGATYDCDDYARDFKKYVCDPNGVNSWILVCRGHALNVVQMPSDGLVSSMCKYCVIEPQRGGDDPKQNKGCWIAACTNSPTVPEWILTANDLEKCSSRKTFPNEEGEPDPLTDPETCRKFVEKTGIQIDCPKL